MSEYVLRRRPAVLHDAGQEPEVGEPVGLGVELGVREVPEQADGLAHRALEAVGRAVAVESDHAEHDVRRGGQPQLRHARSVTRSCPDGTSIEYRPERTVRSDPRTGSWLFTILRRAVVEVEPGRPVDLGERLRAARARRPFELEGVADDVLGVEVARQRERGDRPCRRTATVPSSRSSPSGAGRAELLGELAAGRGRAASSSGGVLALRDRPRALVLAGPERAAHVREQHLRPVRAGAVQQHPGAVHDHPGRLAATAASPR